MNLKSIYFLREVLVMDGDGKDTIAYEFSYDNGGHREPHFYFVSDTDTSQASALYLAWGGIRADGYRQGSTVKSPGSPFIQSKGLWRKD